MKTQVASRLLLTSIALAASLTFSGCGRDSSIEGPEFLPLDQRSDVTMKIREYIETGGVVDVAVDIAGDIQYLATHLDTFLDEVRKVQPDFAQVPFRTTAFAAALGLDGIGGFGLSSRPLDEKRYRNLSFVHVVGERRGLLKLSGGDPAPLRILEMAEASVDLAIEVDLDLKSLNETFGNAAEAAGASLGRAGWTAFAVTPIPGTAVTTLDILNQLETRAFFILDLDPSKPMTIPVDGSTVEIPSIQLVLHIEGLAPVLAKLRPRIDALPQFETAETPDGFTVTHLDDPDLAQTRAEFGIDPVFRVNTTANTVTLASSPAAADGFGKPQKPLGKSSVWKETARDLPTEGNGLTFVNPATAGILREFIDNLAATTDEPIGGIFQLQLRMLGLTDSGYAAVSQNLPDGIFTIANAESTHKPTMVSTIMGNPVMIGMLSAMAIPAFQKVRVQSQEVAITNNLRMVVSAGHQMMLENGVREATYEEIIAEGYFPPLESISGESYDDLVVRDVGGTLSVTTYDGSVVSYSY